MKIDVKKVPNDGKHTKEKTVITFLQPGGFKIPEEIWIGMSDEGIEITAPTKERCIAGIEQSNRRYAAMQRLTSIER